MLKVFLAEDESVVREGLRDNIAWQQYGFEFAGEAADGEMALLQIRRLVPDLLITDIRMPFMDGLSLCHIVHQEFPNMKMIIISGFDDFEYARRAIMEGVDQYLSKPVTRRAMENALSEVKKKIESEREQEDYVRQFQLERQEYEQFYRRVFFEQIFSGKLSVEEIYAQAQRLNLNINGPCYNLIFFSLVEDTNKNSGNAEEFALCQEKLIHYFLRFSQYLFFRWSINTYCVVVKGERDLVVDYTTRGVDIIRQTMEECGHLKWYVSAGEPVERFSQLQDCYHQVNHLFSYRFLAPEEHMLTSHLAERVQVDNESEKLSSMDVNKVDPEILREFLKNGQKEEIEGFTEGYLGNLQDVLKSRMFRDYLLLNLHFTAIAYVREIGGSTEKLEDLFGSSKEMASNLDKVPQFIMELLELALDEREAREGVQGNQMLKEALNYIDEHFTEEQLSLNKVASAMEVSANYFSAWFSQSMKMTFVEYVTQKRMEKARELLQKTKLHTAEIAAEVGYRDPHYFSFVFKKTEGKSPREYRSSLS